MRVMSKLYIVSTRSRMDTVDLSRKLTDKLNESGVDVGEMSFSGQFDEGKLSNAQLFKKIISGAGDSEHVLFIAGEETADWGAVMGVCFALKKDVILLSEKDYEVPFMAAHMRTKSIRVENITDVDAYIAELVGIIGVMER